jgi:hypothetical protein
MSPASRTTHHAFTCQTRVRHITVVALLGIFLFCVRAKAGDQLPAEVAINKEAGRGGHVIVKLRVETGEELPFILDTGAPITLLDKSLEPRLAQRVFTIPFHLSLGRQQCGIHPAPKMFLGGVQVKTDAYMATYDFSRAWTRRDRIMGILGMDFLRHYCVQLDFQASKMRFLGSLNPTELGKAYPIQPSHKGQRFPRLLVNAGQNAALPVIPQAGLLGGTNTTVLIDTGANLDGAVDKAALKGHYFARFVHFLVPFRSLRIGKGVWDDHTYTKLRLSTVGKSDPVIGAKELLGLRFLSRHLVTFDFPRTTMYLKQTSVGPLGSPPPECQIVLTTRAKID